MTDQKKRARLQPSANTKNIQHPDYSSVERPRGTFYGALLLALQVYAFGILVVVLVAEVAL